MKMIHIFPSNDDNVKNMKHLMFLFDKLILVVRELVMWNRYYVDEKI